MEPPSQMQSNGEMGVGPQQIIDIYEFRSKYSSIFSLKGPI
jgi:hypothetical protein